MSTLTAMPPVAALVMAIRRFAPLPKVTRASDVAVLLAGGAAAAIVTTAINAATTYGLMHGHSTKPVGYVVGILGLGQFLGIIMFAPLVLLWANREVEFPMPHPFAKDVVITIALAFAMVCIGRMAGTAHGDTVVQLVRFALGAIALALTCRHGWRGAAVGIVAANLGIGLTAGPDYDPSTLIAQEVVAFVASALLLSGTSISHSFEVAQRKNLERLEALSAARQMWEDGESQNLEHVGRAALVYDQIIRSSEGIIGDLRRAKRSEDIMRLTGDLLATTRSATHTLMQEIYPAIVHSTDGLWGALRAKQLPEDVQLRTSFSGNQAILSRAGSLSIYRVAAAALDHLVGMETSEIRLRIRVGRRGGVAGAYIRVRARTTLCRSNLSTAQIARLRRLVSALDGQMRNTHEQLVILLPDAVSISATGPAPAAWTTERKDVALHVA